MFKASLPRWSPRPSEVNSDILVIGILRTRLASQRDSFPTGMRNRFPNRCTMLDWGCSPHPLNPQNHSRCSPVDQRHVGMVWGMKTPIWVLDQPRAPSSCLWKSPLSCNAI